MPPKTSPAARRPAGGAHALNTRREVRIPAQRQPQDTPGTPEPQDSVPISVNNLLRREGRSTHAADRPIRPRTQHFRLPDPSDSWAGSKASRRAGAAAGALVAAASVFGAAVLTDATGGGAADLPSLSPGPAPFGGDAAPGTLPGLALLGPIAPGSDVGVGGPVSLATFESAGVGPAGVVPAPSFRTPVAPGIGGVTPGAASGGVPAGTPGGGSGSGSGSGGLGGVVENTGSALGGAVKNTGGALGGVVEDTGGTLGGVVGGPVGGVVKDTGGALGGAVKDTGGAVGGLVEDTGGALGGTVGKLTTPVTGLLGGGDGDGDDGGGGNRSSDSSRSSNDEDRDPAMSSVGDNDSKGSTSNRGGSDDNDGGGGGPVESIGRTAAGLLGVTAGLFG